MVSLLLNVDNTFEVHVNSFTLIYVAHLIFIEIQQDIIKYNEHNLRSNVCFLIYYTRKILDIRRALSDHETTLTPKFVLQCLSKARNVNHDKYMR